MAARKDGAPTQPVRFSRKHTALGAAVESKRAQLGRYETSIYHGQRAAPIFLQLLQNSVHAKDLSWCFRPCSTIPAYRSVGWKCCRLMLLETNDVARVAEHDRDLFPYQQHHLQRRGREHSADCHYACWSVENVTMRLRKQPQVQLNQHLHFHLSQVRLLDRTKLQCGIWAGVCARVCGKWIAVTFYLISPKSVNEVELH